MKRFIIAALAAFVITPAATADAATWRNCSTSSAPVRQVQTDYSAVYSNLRARAPMNCASARYALSFVRRYFRDDGIIPRRFFDGYVTWRGRLVGGSYGDRVEYRESSSGTAFRVTVVRFG